MANPEKRLKDRELVLLIADAAGGLEGRTVAQKLAYFGGVALDQPTGHTAHYYGPFSYDVEGTLERLVMSGVLNETIERIPDWRGGPEASKHVYTLTERGQEDVDAIRAAHKAEAAVIDQTVEAIREAIPGFQQRTLSAAAKIHLIISEEDRPLTTDELQRLAKGLGWRLSPKQIGETLNVLKELDLLEITA